MKSALEKDQDQNRQRRIIYLSIFLAVIEAVAIVTMSLPQLWRAIPVPGVSLTLIIYGCVASFFLAFLGIWLARGQHLLISSRILMLAFPLPFFPMVLTVGGQGVLFGILALVLITVVGTITLPRDRYAIGVMIGMSAALLIIALDIFGSSSRYTFPNVPTYILTFVLVAIFGFMILKQFPGYPIRIKLVFALLGATLITAGILAFFAQTTTQAILKENISNQFRNSTDKTATAVGDLLQNQVNLLETLSLNQTLQNGLIAANESYTGTIKETQDRIYNFDQQWIRLAYEKKTDDPLLLSVLENPIVTDLKEYQKIFPSNVEFMLTDQYGALVSATRIIIDYYQADEDWWKNAYAEGKGKPFISKPEYDTNVQEFSFQIVVPVHDRGTNNVIGVLRTTYRTALLEELLKVQLGTTGAADLLFPGDKPKMTSGVRLIDTDQDTIELARSALTSDSLDTTYLGIPSIISSALVKTTDDNPTIKDMEWLLVTHQARNEAFAPISRQNRTTLLIVLAVIGVISLAAIFLAGFINQPIVRLTEVAQKIAGGQLETKAEVETSDEIGTLATSFNSMTAQLRDLIGSLEQRVAERTRAVQASAEVSRRLSTILDQKELVLAVVDEIQKSFNYYHVHIYLFDDLKEKLILAGGTGEAGRVLLERQHTIHRGRGLVGQAAENNLVVLVPDTSADPNWMPNPLLPETRSEIAVPIAIGKDVLGVMDVQHNVKEGLGAQDTELLQSLANQVAVALQNARSYTQIQHQAERETIINTISQRIQTAGSPELVLQIAARELASALGTQRTVVQIESTSVVKTDKTAQRSV